jgi:hypothetical protein
MENQLPYSRQIRSWQAQQNFLPGLLSVLAGMGFNLFTANLAVVINAHNHGCLIS